MPIRGRLKEVVRLMARRMGYDVASYVTTVPARRQRMFEHYGIELVLDIGANVGQYGDELRRHGYEKGILSVEPVAAAFNVLKAKAATDDLWDIRRVAVGDHEGTLTLRVSEGSIFSSALPVLEHTVAASPDARQVGEEVVPLTTLEGLAPSDGKRLAVKIDVQGFERAVIAGGQSVLRRAQIVEVELSPRPVYEGQILMQELMQILDRFGYVLATTENLFRVPHSGRSLQFNGIFVREDS